MVLASYPIYLSLLQASGNRLLYLYLTQVLTWSDLLLSVSLADDARPNKKCVPLVLPYTDS